MKILGLDLATKKTGWSYFDGDKLIDCGIFFADEDEHNIHTRILQIRDCIFNTITKYNVDYLVAEDVPISSHANLNTAKMLAILQGCILDVAYIGNIGLRFYSPTDWRSIMGLFDGTRAGTKRDVQKQRAVDMVNELYPHLDLKYYKRDTKDKISGDDIAESILLVKSFLIDKKIIRQE